MYIVMLDKKLLNDSHTYSSNIHFQIYLNVHACIYVQVCVCITSNLSLSLDETLSFFPAVNIFACDSDL